ncbi:hypothetical protein SS1G_13672 [Sclerotinia sclerotiorum 1980 UF-70]|uniref:Uncharacterized protein n=1 Tax=Sclerotinia sclerotiorum (strain ATCC 18683 / 1980 / Ss-1) TaxID=665079 RepID=A7F7U2_SCLS1|nr:hypothetical protein SS1G_13672 [Sclerotinia sclerotiorum 1980 UF-70]EDN98813.1 hypothetical protein SS1G_13672 [Sclerotinia sclerotiorum 1980 UF-70]
MEVDKDNWKRLLLPILKDISNATFVSFDLEMSGITTRPKHSNQERTHDVGKPSLQQQYEEVKDAAETFQVLQIGITCVEEDHYYLAKPYNINLSPLLIYDRVFDLDRNFCFSSSASNFLQSNGFDIGAVFTKGVPYLSEQEEAEARERYDQRIERNASIPSIIFDPSDVGTLEFYRRARSTITEWIEAKEPKMASVNVDNPKGPLNGFQRRLVHQLVRSEFPQYRCFARLEGSFMQVEMIDHDREAKKTIEQLKTFNQRIAQQSGARFIFEALCGGDLTGIDPMWLYTDDENTQPNHHSSRPFLESQLAAVIKTLKKKQHVIVGHNLFTDLCFLYKTFIGTLPAGVGDFQSQIHSLFPFVIDTKYLATYNSDAMNPRVNLKELLIPFQKVHMPLILLHEKHNTYGGVNGKSHEAGFDSWMTAELFVKLSAKLYAEQTDLNQEENRTRVNYSEIDYDSDSDSDDQEGSGGASLASPSCNSPIVRAKPNSDAHRPSDWHAMQLNNPFSALNVEYAGKGDKKGKKVAFGDQMPRQWIPGLEENFWEIYKNKLRVNAVEGGVCDLGCGLNRALNGGRSERIRKIASGRGDWV